MKIEKIKTLGELKKQGYQSKSIKDELRDNLILKIKEGVPAFEGIHGFDFYFRHDFAKRNDFSRWS